MKMVSCVMMVTLLSVAFCGNLIIFGDLVRNFIFNQRRDAVVLFVREEDNPSKIAFQKYGVVAEGDWLFSTLSSSSRDYERFAKEIGVTLNNLPFMVVIKMGLFKYVSETKDVT